MKNFFFALLTFFLLCEGKTLHAQEVFNPEYVHRVDVIFPNAGWWDSLTVHYSQFLITDHATYETCDVIIDGVTVGNSGIRFKGQYSNFGFAGNKKPFKLDFNEFVSGQNFQGLKKLNLHNFAADPSFLREHLAYMLFRQQGIPASRTSYTELYLNNQFWGVYLIVEEIDKTFIRSRFGESNHTLYKCVSDTELGWRGWNDSLYHHTMKVEFDGAGNGYTPLLNFLDLFNNRRPVDFAGEFRRAFDYDTYCKTLCLDVLLNNWDSYYDNGRNFSIYFDGHQLHWIPWDYNLCMWDRSANLLPRDNSADHYKPLHARMAENPILLSQYYAASCAVLNSIRVPEVLAYTQRYHALVRPHVFSDPNKFYTNADFDNNLFSTVTVMMIRGNVLTPIVLPGINELLPARLSVLKKELFVAGYDCATADETRFDFSLTPNPAPAGEIYMTVWADARAPQFELLMTDIMGRKVEDVYVTAMDDNRYRLHVPELRKGEYIVTLLYNGKPYSRKLILL